jgi:hypothetical protein
MVVFPPLTPPPRRRTEGAHLVTSRRQRRHLERLLPPLARQDGRETVVVIGLGLSTKFHHAELDRASIAVHPPSARLLKLPSGELVKPGNRLIGGRLISKNRAVEVLQRPHARQADVVEMSFEALVQNRVPKKLFRFTNGYQPHSLNGTFRRLVSDSRLNNNEQGQTGLLYSLRRKCAILQLLHSNSDIHTLSKQMGNSAAMIERHYSKLTATMAADKLV